MSEDPRRGGAPLEEFILNLRNRKTGTVYDETIAVMPDQRIHEVIDDTMRWKDADLVSIMYPDRRYFEKPRPDPAAVEALYVGIVVNLRYRSDAQLTRVEHVVERGQSADPIARYFALAMEADVVSITHTDGTPYVVRIGDVGDKA